MKKGFFNAEDLQGDYLKFAEEIRRGTPAAVFGVSSAVKYLLAAIIDSPVLYVTADAAGARTAADNLSVLTGKKAAVIAAKDEVLSYRKALSKDSLFRRIEGVYALENGGGLAVAEIDALLQLFPKTLPVLHFAEGAEADFSSVARRLSEMGYTRVAEVESKGAFAPRGDILDIFPVGAENPVRVDFFGDEVEKIKPYDLETGNRLEPKTSLTILPANDCFICGDEIPAVKEILRESLRGFTERESYVRASNVAAELLSALEACEESAAENGAARGKNETGRPFAADPFLTPLLKNSGTIFDILPKNAVIVFDESKTLRDKCEGIYKEFEERFSRLKQGGEVLPFSREQLIERQAFYDGLSRFRLVALQTFTGNPFFFTPLKIFNFRVTPVSRYLNATPALITDIKNWMKGGYRILLFCGNENRLAKMSEALSDAYVSTSKIDDFKSLTGVALTSETLDKGFIAHEAKFVAIGTSDLYTKPVEQKRVKRRRGDLFTAPEVGDYAVHETHGVGRVIGTKKIETTDGTKEYVALEYKDGDTLYVPVEHMDSLSKYVGGEKPALSKIGGADFERVKARVRASIKKMAFDLKALYAERAESHGFAFPENEAFMSEFEEAFPYELTPDQADSVAEIKADMCGGKVMDRLLCGDVGFGKTEVAFRAAYLCILGGKQAALMCPGTVLCNQHYDTALKRFGPFGVRIAVLNRFATPKETAQTLQGLKDGTIDFVIGTHRLLSADVHFKDLGLLILDEEQRFGVEHKEKIKNMRKNIDCLTMTATPIPRTLHMSLTGIRDISTIQTAPRARLPVQTYVAEETETLIRDACIRELSRDGQVFILYNRVESIYTFAAKIAAIVPEAKISVAHGRMDKTVLENNVYDFYSGKTNVLVTTTIIENGIDLPNANTLIVIDSERLGISQLYQLRGRVGRGTRLAHAYFTYKAERVMTETATERLKAIMQFTELGSGYKLAMRDLEIRGAGNVLGAEQHGHMDKVGYELYAKLLKEELTGEREEEVELDVRADAYIPEDYVESSAGRLDTYKQIAEIRSVADYKRVYQSLRDVYGDPPQPVVNLLVVAAMKSYASRLGVRKICAGKGFGSLEFTEVKKLGEKGLQAAQEKYAKEIRLNMSVAPVIEFAIPAKTTEVMAEMTKFLKFASTFA